MIKDSFEIMFCFAENTARQPELWQKILSFLDESFLPKPNLIRLIEKPVYKIENCIDEIIINSLLHEKAIELKSTKNDISITILPVKNINMLITIDKEVIQNVNSSEIIKLFKGIITIKNPLFAYANFYNISKKLYSDYYSKSPRTKSFAGLEWIQFFGEKEFIEQGAEIILNSKSISFEKIGNGLFIQVGDSHLELLTKKGFNSLIHATEEMPSIKFNEN